jgi:ribosomal protein L11 methyltransferase
MAKPNLGTLTTDATTALRLSEELGWLFEDQAAVAAFENEPPRSWSVAIHFGPSLSAAAVRAKVAQVAGRALAGRLRFAHVASTDWVKKSLEGLTPVRAGRFVLHGGHDRHRMTINRVAIEIEAALAFGTGHHGTTRGCLLAFDAMLKDAAFAPKRILDVGTGSGVLAIAAARTTRRGDHGRIVASDIDPVAVRAARENAVLNHAAARIEFVRTPGLSAGLFAARGPYDLVFANILLPPLRRMAAPMVRLLAPRARVILSGLLPDQANAALAAYHPFGLRLRRRHLNEGWATLELRAP